jgi:predicted AlkP superfamily phosphohydrolase/phosphomutase
MNTGNGARTLAIGVDAAEGALVKRLMDQGALPSLRSLLGDEASGRWLRVRSPAHIGSGTVWPTFITGDDPTAHGVYSEWRWRPESMSLSRYHGRHLTPFWAPLAQDGVPVGVFDVPFARPVGISQGFEVSEWWAHDSTGAGLQAGPNRIRPLVDRSPPHPLSGNRFVHATPDRRPDLEELTAACVEGVRLRGRLAQQLIAETRPRLSLMVFPEIHHASHQLWHTIDGEHDVYRGREFTTAAAADPLLRQVYRAVDQQIGELVGSVPHDTVMVFALHGMRPALGFPAFLGSLLVERGFARLASWRSQSWTSRAMSLLGAAKRHTPDALKTLYYHLTPTVATHAVARPTMIPAYDWSATRAFALPTDQYGWIRINLTGRESAGCVPMQEYEETCRELELLLRGLVDERGRLLVQNVVRTAPSADAARDNPLPDLVVHWEFAAFASPLTIKGSTVRVDPIGKKSTGQHASEGFCIYRGPRGWGADGVVAAQHLGSRILAGL